MFLFAVMFRSTVPIILFPIFYSFITCLDLICSFTLDLFLTFCSALGFGTYLRASLVPFAVTFCFMVPIFLFLVIYSFVLPLNLSCSFTLVMFLFAVMFHSTVPIILFPIFYSFISRLHLIVPSRFFFEMGAWPQPLHRAMHQLFFVHARFVPHILFRSQI
jgi:hypothetical protein